MCGIAGILGPGANLRLVRAMAESQRHRGPDGDGAWCGDEIALGHRRLKIIDLSDAASQPMRSACGRYTMVFNGELYNYLELRTALPAVAWRTQSDTEVVLEAFATWGGACLTRFAGMFAFAIWDARERRLFCARDPLGIKPFHWAMRGGDFLFASEIDALLTAGIPAEPNPRAVYDYLARDLAEHSDETFFKGVNKLPAGSYMEIQSGGPPRTIEYWRLAARPQDVIAPDAAVRREELLALLDSCVRLNLRADVPIAVAVSAGLDSATLLSLIERNHPDPDLISTVTFSFAETEYDERPWVEQLLAGSRRRRHFVEIEAADFAESASAQVRLQQEPFAGLPIYAYARCAQAIRADGAVIMLDGSGLDEAFAGYSRFLPAYWSDLFASGDFTTLSTELAASGYSDSGGRGRALQQMSRAIGPAAGQGVGQDLTTSVRPETVTAELRSAAAPLPQLDRPFAGALANQMYQEMRYTKLPRALRFRDRLSMSTGVELRPPFVDHRLFEFAFALPASDKIRAGVQKAIVRDTVGHLLPTAVANAPKRQVQTPQREWFRGPLAGWVREMIDRPAFWELGWVDRTRGRAAMESFLAGEGENSFFLWQWINLGLWMEDVVRRPRNSL